jgi:hypothetical protein
MFQRLLFLALFFIIFVLLWIGRIDAQEEDGDIIIINERVGKVIDLEERNKFILFPGIKGFKSAVFLKSVNGSYIVKITYNDDTTGEEKIKKIPQTESSIMRYRRIINHLAEELSFEDIQEVKNETPISSKQKYIPWSFVFMTLGKENLSGDVTNTLNSGVLVQFLGVEYTPLKANFLKFCLNWIEMGEYNYKFTSEEKQLIEERYEIQSEGGISIPGFSSGAPVDPEEDLKLQSWRMNLNVTLSPIIGPLRPFIGFGVGLFFLYTSIDGDNNPGPGTQSYYRIGADLYPNISKPFWKALFLRVEYVNGSIPDWRERMLTELRPIRGGQFKILRFGFGFDLAKI